MFGIRIEEKRMKNQRERRNARANQSLPFSAGLLLGSLTGAMVMLLMAPRAGEKSRFQLQK
jgi:gas vesicle protein